jgi:signal peptidase I
MKAERNNWLWFGIIALLYFLWVLWLENYWFLTGIAIIFDWYITKTINWTFWRKREWGNSNLIEWIDAFIFAVVAVTLINIFLFQNYKIPTGSMEKTLMIGDHLYVSKVAYGPRLPNTPLSLPFTQHTMPLTTNVKSFVDWIELPYKRLRGFGNVRRDDAVVFNFPEGDTVAIEHSSVSYYSIVRDEAMGLKDYDINHLLPVKTDNEYKDMARDNVRKNYIIAIRPVDKRDNYIKRCVAIPGDTLQIINKKVYVNGIPQKSYPGIQYSYYIYMKENQDIPNKTFERMEVYEHFHRGNVIQAWLTREEVEKIAKFGSVQEIIPNDYYNQYFTDYFPHDTDYQWTLNNFGPLYIPKKGTSLEINLHNLCLYERIISCYEHNKLTVKDGIIYINNKPAREYTFKMDYYWMMGDNRERSLDSRFWGFVPEDHIVGKPRFIWLSLNKNKSFPANIRWGRMLKRV